VTLPGVLLQGVTPFAITLCREFRGVTSREGVVIHGPSGWGEFAPFEDYGNEYAGRWLATALEAAYGTWPASKRQFIHVNAIIPGVSADVAADLVRDIVQNDGCSTIKVKVTGDLAGDEARVAAVRHQLDRALGVGIGKIRIDANACWSVAEAIAAIHCLSAYNLEYVEQPVESNEELREVRKAIDTPIAVDEGIRKNKNLDAQALGELRELADVAIIKPAPVGGVQRGIEVAELLRMPIVVSNGMESSIGLCTSLALAGALDIDLACGLGTGKLIAQDLVESPLVATNGQMEVQRLIPNPDSLAAARARVSDDQAQFWLSRLEQAWQSDAVAPWHEKVGR